jgi:hypothetical protein
MEHGHDAFFIIYLWLVTQIDIEVIDHSVFSTLEDLIFQKAAFYFSTPKWSTVASLANFLWLIRIC